LQNILAQDKELSHNLWAIAQLPEMRQTTKREVQLCIKLSWYR